MSRPSVIIIGGGVFGLTAAFELDIRGWQVTLLDQGSVPYPDAASTDISKVVRMDYGTDEQYTAMGEQAVAAWRERNPSPQHPLYHEDGFLVMTREEEMRPGSFEHASYHFLRQRGHPLRRVRRDDLARHHPAWNSASYGDGYFNPSGGWTASGQVIRQYKYLLGLNGVQVHEGARFVSLVERGSQVTGIRFSDGTEWEADLTLAAAGAWTPFLFPELRTVMQTTGQPVLHLKPARPEEFRAPAFPVWAADIGRTGWYGFPANADGIVKVANHGPGVPIMDPEQSRAVGADEIARFRGFLADTFPTLADAPLHSTRQCWYCDSFDGHFWIDHHPERPGLVIAAGDSGHAFKFAPVLGSLIADVAERKPNPWSARFAWRSAGDATGDGARQR